MRFRQIHMDFHTSEQIEDVGLHFDPEAFADRLARAAVDSVTVFARCHHGMIYYDTKFTEAKHPGLSRNLLGEQIEALHRRDIRAPIYITVGWDEHMASRHPEYVEVNPEGRRNGAPPLGAGWRKLCLNSPYIDYVLAQSQEVLERFPVDGLFFDIVKQGDCCCPRCLKGMLEAGYDPENPAARKMWGRDVTTRYCRRQTELVRRFNQECSIFYNAGHVGPWIRSSLETYTHLELESLPTGGWGYDHFPLTVRYARNLELEYLGMTGKFQKSWADFGGYKPVAALEYDCFVALAHGARCSVGDQLHPSGVIDDATYDLIEPVYTSVAAKEPWCTEARPVVDIAIVTPEGIGREDGRVDSSARGALRLLQEAHYQFDIVDFDMPWDAYRLLIMPDKIVLTDEHAAKVKAYLARGGRVLASHQSGLTPAGDRFALEEFGVELVGALDYSPDYIQALAPLSDGVRATQHVMYDQGLRVKAVAGETLARIWAPYFNRSWRHFTSHRHAPAHKPTDDPGAVQHGGCIYFAHPVFSSYGKHGPEALRQMLLNAVRRLLPQPVLRTDAPSTAHISLMRQDEQKRTVLHVLHYIPERRYTELDLVLEKIPLHNLSVDLAVPLQPTRVYLAPGEEALSWKYADGRVHVNVPRIEGHAMIVVE